MAVVALILALVSLLFFWFPFIAAPLGILAIILAIVAIAGGREKRRQGQSEALPILSLVLSCMALIPTLIIVIIMIIIGAIAASFDTESLHEQTPKRDFTTM
ncbi:MAG: hypothetical protein EA401_00785 [Planctomycetota bacterium]|nr:MAG: hypothetical protein EA401_00785 [Planctomycetota bacterium]